MYVQSQPLLDQLVQLQEKLTTKAEDLVQCHETIAALKLELATAEHAVENTKLRLDSTESRLDTLQEVEKSVADKDATITALQGDIRTTLESLAVAQQKLHETDRLKKAGDHELDELNTVVKGIQEDIRAHRHVYTYIDP